MIVENPKLSGYAIIEKIKDTTVKAAIITPKAMHTPAFSGLFQLATPRIPATNSATEPTSERIPETQRRPEEALISNV